MQMIELYDKTFVWLFKVHHLKQAYSLGDDFFSWEEILNFLSYLCGLRI